MFEKVLIAEDHESANISVQKTLSEIGATDVDYVYYCDDALLRIRKAVADGSPYQLMISDLSFEEDHRKQVINDGVQLAQMAREIQPNLKILIFTAENKLATIDHLMNKMGVNGYVRKARNDAKELKSALEAIKNNKTYLNRELTQAINQQNSYDFSEFDVLILSLLSKGLQQKDFPTILQQNGIKPSGLSSVEKRINRMKEKLNFKTNEQLIAFSKDLGII